MDLIRVELSSVWRRQISLVITDIGLVGMDANQAYQLW